MSKYHHVLRAIYNTPWAILPEKLQAIIAMIEFRAAGGAFSSAELAALGAAVPSPRSSGVVAVLPLFGTIAHRAGMFTQASGGTSVQGFTNSFRQMLADPAVRSIVIDIDSPGGTVDGVPELAAEIFAAREQKKIVAVADTLAASAAYWIGSAATEFNASPSAEVGSIGVYAAHQEFSKYDETAGVKTTLVSAGKYKTEGNEFEPLSEDARAALQARVDEYYGMFVKAVAHNRGVTENAVRNGFGEGRVVGARQAKAEGMVDRIATLDETLARLGVSSAPAAMRAETDISHLALARRDLDLQEVS